jgi:hypothetical protein
MLVDHTLSTLFCIMPSTSAVCTNRASKGGSVVPRTMEFRTAPSTRPKFKLTHYVCREHTDCEEGVELQER